jgi:lysozyme
VTFHPVAIRLKVLLVSVAATLALVGAQPAAALSGPDVSSWQHPNGTGINWGQVRASGMSFAFVKATEGPSGYYQNPYFYSDWAGVRAVGMVRGAYHFARPQYSATNQANFFISVIGASSQPGDLPPALDLEDTGGLSPTDLGYWTQTFLTTVKSLTGRTPIIYSYPYFWRTNMANTTAFAGYPLWLADWTGRSGPNYPLPGGWGSFTFWQFTSQAKVPGISGNVDMSNFCCDSAALSGLATQRTCGNSNPVGPNTPHPSQQVAAVGIDCALWVHQVSSPGFSSLGGVLRGAPAVVASGAGTDPYYIVTGQDHDLWIRSGSAGWQRLTAGGAVVCGDNPTAVIDGGGTLWVACQGQDQALWVGHGPATSTPLPQVGFGSWQSLGGTLTGGPAVALIGGTPTFFISGKDRMVSTRTTSTGYVLTPWICNGHPAAATYLSTTYFACQGWDRALWYDVNSGQGWSGAKSLGGVLVDGTGVAVGPTGPSFFVEGQDVAVWERTLSQGWSSDGGIVDYGVGAAYLP